MSTDPGAGRTMSPKAAALVALILIGTLGAVVGFAIDRTVMSPCSGSGSQTSSEHIPFWARTAEDRHQRWNNLSKSLNLTPSQTVAIDTVLAQQGRLIDAARNAVEPQMRDIMTITRARIDSLLTAEQKAKLDEIRRKRDAKRNKDKPS